MTARDRHNLMFGVCGCGKWGQAPATFNEREHFLKCECGKLMFLQRTQHPHEAGYRDKDKIVPTLEVIK